MPQYFVVPYPAAQAKIASGGTDSTVMVGFDDMEALSVTAPGTLTGTITFLVDVDGSGTYGTLQSGGSDITLGAGKTVTIIDSTFKNLKIHSSGAEGGDRQFVVVKKVLT